MKNRLVIACLLLAICPIFMLRNQEKIKSNFSLKAIQSNYAPSPKWDIPVEDLEKVRSALDQPFHYLGSGGQCFAFVSADDQYVIKFIKQKQFATTSWFPKKQQKKEKERKQLFSALKNSFNFVKDQTGLVFVHLNPSSNLQHTLCVTDNKNKTHHLDLDQLEFVLQKKAHLAYSFIDQLMQKNDLETAKSALEQLIALQVNLCKQGWRNRDPNFRSNWGFIDGNPILIDMGRVVYDEKVKSKKGFKKAMKKGTCRMRQYLSDKHPELLEFFEASLNEYMEGS